MAAVELKQTSKSRVEVTVHGQDSEVHIIRVDWGSSSCSVSPSSDRKDGDDHADFRADVSGIKDGESSVKITAHCYRADGHGVGSSASKEIKLKVDP